MGEEDERLGRAELVKQEKESRGGTKRCKGMDLGKAIRKENRRESERQGEKTDV